MVLLPKSLFGRLLLGLLSIVFVTILVIVALIVRDRREFVFWGDGRADVIATIAELTQQISSVPADERDALIAEITQELSRSDYDDRPPPAPGPDLRSILRAYIGRLAAELGDDYTVRVRRAVARGDDVIPLAPAAQALRRDLQRDRPGGLQRSGGRGAFPGGGAQPGSGSRGPPRARGLDIVVTLPDGDSVTFRADVPRNPPPGMNTTFLELGLLTIVLSAALLFVARAITRPLSELAQAAEAVGRGERRSPLVERGASEIRETTRAFNAMQERLQRYLDSRADTLAAMSHDLRTPLTRLRLRLEKIGDAELREKCARDLEEMQRLIDGSLQFFRTLNEDAAESELETVDVGALCSQLAEEFAEVGHTIELEGAAQCTASARPQAIRRCIANLLENAVRFGSRVSVNLQCGDSVVIRVRDDGPGIPSDELERVFQPFYRVESSRNQDTGGTGLGLSIARDIAQSHGGTLTLHNRTPGLEAILTLPHSVE